MATFCVALVPGENWDVTRDRREQRGWDEHAEFMDELVESGFLVLGGPLGDGRETLHLIEADSEDDVRRRLARDPWSRDRLLEVGRLAPWALWLDGRRRSTGALG